MITLYLEINLRPSTSQFKIISPLGMQPFHSLIAAVADAINSHNRMSYIHDKAC